MAHRVFYSFHYAKDAWRAGQVRNMGILEGNQPVTSNEWEEVKQKGVKNIENWIANNMKYNMLGKKVKVSFAYIFMD